MPWLAFGLALWLIGEGAVAMAQSDFVFRDVGEERGLFPALTGVAAVQGSGFRVQGSGFRVQGSGADERLEVRVRSFKTM